MDTTVMLVVGALVILAIILLVYKVIKVAAFCGIVAAIVYVGAQYALPFWETHLAPYVAYASSLF